MNPAMMPGMDDPSLDGTAKMFYSPQNMQNNHMIMMGSRQFFSIVGGCIAGIMGFEGLHGLAAYAVTQLLLTLAIMVKMKFDYKSNFMKLSYCSTHGFGDGAMSFLLFWTLMRNIVHVY